MSITERAKDMGVENLVKEIKNLRESVDRLEEENQNLKEQIADI
jgi:uncharacterized protein (UPF0335 family)